MNDHRLDDHVRDALVISRLRSAGVAVPDDAAFIVHDLGGCAIGAWSPLFAFRVRARGRLPDLVFVADPLSLAWFGTALLGWPHESPTIADTPYGPAALYAEERLPPGSCFGVVDRDDPSRVYLIVNYVSP